MRGPLGRACKVESGRFLPWKARIFEQAHHRTALVLEPSPRKVSREISAESDGFDRSFLRANTTLMGSPAALQ